MKVCNIIYLAKIIQSHLALTDPQLRAIYDTIGIQGINLEVPISKTISFIIEFV
jgi:hypothetical protein